MMQLALGLIRRSLVRSDESWSKPEALRLLLRIQLVTRLSEHRQVTSPRLPRLHRVGYGSTPGASSATSSRDHMARNSKTPVHLSDRWKLRPLPLAPDGSAGSPVPARVEEVFCEGRVPPRYVGEFCPSAQRASHPPHKVPYRACFKPALPASSSSVSRALAIWCTTHPWAGALPSWRQDCLADVRPAAAPAH